MRGRFGGDCLPATGSLNGNGSHVFAEFLSAGESRNVPDANGAHCPIWLEIMIELVNITDSLDFLTNFARNRVVSEYGHSQIVCLVLPW